MKKKIIIGIFSIAGGVMLSVKAFSQIPDPEMFVNTPVILDPKFFIAILGGVLLALGFQLVLTNLSVAAGVTAVGNIKEKAEHPSVSEHSESSKNNSSSSTPLGVKLMSGAGAWTMITGAVSLFFASLLAVKLSLIPDNTIGLTLGLIIWAVFFMVMLYLESRAIGSIMGGLFSAAVSAVKAGFSGINSLFSRSESSKMEHAVTNAISSSIGSVKEEISDMVDDFDLKDKLEDYFTKLNPSNINSDKLKDELTNLLTDIRLEERVGENPVNKEFFIKLAEKEPKFSKKDISYLGRLYDMAVSAMKVSGVVGGIGGATALLSKTPPVQNVKEQVEEYLRKTGNPELQPEVLKAELNEIFKHPSSAVEIIRNKSKAFDKESIVSAVAAKEGVSKEQAQKVADKVEEAINKVRETVQSNIDLVESKAKQMKDKVTSTITDTKDQFVEGIESRIRNFFDRVDRPELNYERLKLDFSLMMKDPKLTPKILRAKLHEMDSDTLIATLAATDRFNREEAENIVQKFEEAKTKMLLKIDQAEAAIRDKAEQTRLFALQQAENTRKTAVAASWWLLGTLVISGAAAALGGILAL